MKRFIKYYDADSNRMKRFAVNDNLSIATELTKAALLVRFYNKETGDTRIELSLNVRGEKLQRFVGNVLICQLDDIVEDAVLHIVQEDYQLFLSSSHRSFPISKFGQKWVFEFNSILQVFYLRQGKQIEKITPVIKKIFER